MICDPTCPYRDKRRCVAAGKDVLDIKQCPSIQTIMEVTEENATYPKFELREGFAGLPGCD